MFPAGFNSTLKKSWAMELDYYKTRSYLPIFSIPACAESALHRDGLITTFGKMLTTQLQIQGQLHSAISYLISEAFDNIVEHANIDNGWIMVQNYKKKAFFDICIVDSGIGILGSFQRMNFTDINTHAKAIQEAINGRSTKAGENARGYGIRTSRYMLVKGLEGKYLLFSGNAFYIWTNEQELINSLDSDFQWDGTIVALRIPNVTPRGFNYVKYIE